MRIHRESMLEDKGFYCRYALWCAILSILAITTDARFLSFDNVSAVPNLPPRPRLILTADRLSTIKAFISNSTEAAQYYNNTVRQGEWILSVRPIPVHGPGSTNDLGGARQVLQRVYALGLLWRLTANTTWASRCVQELINAVSWNDWALPDDALVTGEMEHAVAVGIDWLEGYWELGHADDRSMLVDGLVRLGMQAMKVGYTPPLPSYANNNTFINTTNNYGEVVNGGAIIGVLGLLGEPAASVPDWVTNFVLPNALQNLIGSFQSFAPAGDGSWYEGPNYHNYVMRYAAPLIWSLVSVLGNDQGLLAYAGVETTADSTVYHLSPQYTLWNWADTDEQPETTSANLPFAAHFGASGVAYALREYINNVPVPASETGNPSMQATVGLLYYSPLGDRAARAAMPKDRHFVGRNLAMFWSSFVDPNATFVGVKAGENGYNVHLHQDMGSFIFHSQGRRFAADIGRDSYALPCYFCLPFRWRYYRLNAFGHNTITFNNRTHDFSTAAFITQFNTTGDGPSFNGANAWTVMDLAPMYASLRLARWERGFVTTSNRTVLIIVDEIDIGSAKLAQNLTWALHTNASVTLVGPTSATITIAGVTAVLHVLPSATDCPGASLSATPVALEPPQLPTDGFVRLDISSATAATCKRIAVALGVADVPLDPAIRPIRDWAHAGPFM